jgi:hypothetical protein
MYLGQFAYQPRDLSCDSMIVAPRENFRCRSGHVYSFASFRCSGAVVCRLEARYGRLPASFSSASEADCTCRTPVPLLCANMFTCAVSTRGRVGSRHAVQSRNLPQVCSDCCWKNRVLQYTLDKCSDISPSQTTMSFHRHFPSAMDDRCHHRYTFFVPPTSQNNAPSAASSNAKL